MLLVPASVVNGVKHGMFHWGWRSLSRQPSLPIVFFLIYVFTLGDYLRAGRFSRWSATCETHAKYSRCSSCPAGMATESAL
jgi:hypothetical protein